MKALACELPAASGTPLAKWSCPARETAARGITASVSARTVRRWLAQDVLKPWRHRSWIFPRDPYFAVKAARVFDLYERIWEARPLGGDEYVLSADEKPGVQARRIHPALPSGPGRPMRVGKRVRPLRHPGLPGRLRRAPRAGDGPLRAGDRHQAVRGFSAAGVLGGGRRRLASWLDSGRTDERRLAERGHGAPAGARLPAQPEICFSIIQRKLLVPDDFADLPALAAKIGVFERRHNSAAAFQPGQRGPVIW